MVVVTLHDRAVDLLELAVALQRRFKAHPPTDYLQGKTDIRDAVADILVCSMLEAEMLVDQLESRHMIAFAGDPTQRPRLPTGWTFPVFG